MQYQRIVFVRRSSLISTRQMIAIENNGYRPVYSIQLVQEVNCCLIGDAHTLGIGVDLSAFVIVQVFCSVGPVELIIGVPVVVSHVILHGDELQELRVFLFVQLVDDVLVGSRIADVRRIVDSVLVRDCRLAVQRVELAESELLVVGVAQR